MTLDGSGSTDADSDPLTYAWQLLTVPSGSTAALDDLTSPMPGFFADLPGEYVATLVVNDGTDNSTPDTVVISTANTPPVADAGLDQTVPVGATTVVFGGASSDANGDPLTYAWSLTSAPNGSAASLTSPTDTQTGITIDAAGEYVIQLVVNDGYDDSTPDTVVITTSNTAPVADAGLDLEALVGDTVELDGTFSFDIDDDPLTYLWSIISRPDGSTALLTDALVATTQLVVDLDGLYIVQLIVSDGLTDSDPDTATITVAPANEAPMALASANATAVAPGDSVQLDGSGSTDPEGDTLTYAWSLVTPTGSSAALNSATAAAPTFFADVAGNFVATLVVNDGEFDSAPSAVSIVASLNNNAPQLAAIGNRVMFLGSSLNFRLFGVDPDVGDVLTYSLPAGPTNSGVVPGSGEVVFTPSEAQLGMHSFTARVDDNGGLFDTQVFAVEVREEFVAPPENSPPTLAPIADQQLFAGAGLTLQTDAQDPDAGDTLTYSLPLAPAGMTIDAAGAINWTPAAAQVGRHDATVQVADTLGAVALQSFIVTVNPVNRAPIAVDDLYDARIGETTSEPVPGVLGNDNDPDGDPLTASLVSNVSNGVLDFRNDGSFDYTPGLPDQIGPVELELQCGQNFPGSQYQTRSTIAVGDVDNDGETELVGIGGESFVASWSLFILNSNCEPELATSPNLFAAGGIVNGSHTGLLDIDGDGDLEIIGIRAVDPANPHDQGNNLIAVHHDDTLAWPGDGASEDMALAGAVGNCSCGVYFYGGPTFADIDGNGTVEIIMTWYTSGVGGGTIRTGITVYNSADGTILWEYTGALSFGDADYKAPVIVDLDMDGTMEIIWSIEVIDHTGALEFTLVEVANPLNSRGFLTSAVANFDDDPFPEIVARDLYYHYVFEHDGTIKWQLDQSNNSGDQITVADFDGDGEVEFAYNLGLGNLPGYLTVWNADGSLLWTHQNEPALQTTLQARINGYNATAFDANADGAFDIVVHYAMGQPNDNGLYIFDGKDGSVLEFVPLNVGIGEQRFVTIADIDDDGEAEMLASFGPNLTGSLAVFQGTAENPLPPAPATRNQWIYNAAMVDDRTGEIITDPTPHWLQPGLNGYNMVSAPDKVYLTEKCSLTWEGFSANDPSRRTSFTNGSLLVGDVDNDGDTEIVGWNDGHAPSQVGGLFILNGADCSTQLRGSPDIIAAGSFARLGQVHMSLVDLDGNGDLEIVGRRRINSAGVVDRKVQMLAANHDGTLFWPGDGASEGSQLVGTNLSWSTGPSFADLDADGDTEIIMRWEQVESGSSNTAGIAVFNGVDGTLAWEFESLPKLQNGGALQAPVVVADIDVDGTMEIIVDRSVVSHDGMLEFVLPIESRNSSVETVDHLFTAVANFDADPFAEIVAHDRLNHYMFDHLGNVVWQIPRDDESQSQITVGDFDGDGEMEYALQQTFLSANLCGSYTGYMAVHESDGSPLWDHQENEPLHSTCGVQFNNPVATAFDANGDGAHDIVIHHRGDNLTTDRNGLYIFDGRDGSVLTKYTFPAYSESYRSVAIADVDQDDEAELVLSWTSGIRADTVVLEGTASQPMPPAPPIVNQQFMHRGLVGDSGQILTNPVPHWLQPGANGFLAIPLQSDPLAGTTDSFTYLARDGQLNSNTATVTFDVQPAGTAPAFLTQPDTLTTVGFPYQYAPRVVDADPGDSVSFTLAAAPAGMTMSNNGQLNWLPDAEGSFAVSIIASDTIGFATPQSFTLLVGQPVVVPDVVGQTETNADTTLTGANLLTGAVRTSTHATVAAGSVFEQTPIAGSVAEFGASVDLMVSSGPAPEDVDDDLDGFTENEGDCNDADAAIAPGAADPAGDGIDQDCDGIDGNLVLAEILVSPGTATLLTGQSVGLTATGVFADGTSQNLSGVVAWTNGPTFSSGAAGAFTVTATRGAISGSATINVVDRVAGDTVPPVVEITAPGNNSTVTEPVDVTGTASDANFLKYELAYALAGETGFTTIVTSTTPVFGSVLGQFDPTMLINDLYTIRLTVFDAGGNQTIAETTVQVDGNMKVGNFTLSFTDLQIPLSGIPITITRTYDSRDKSIRDFGHGWSLGLKSVDVRTNRELGSGWRVDRSGLAFTLVPTAEHKVIVTLPGGKIEEFDMRVSPNVSPIVPFPPSRVAARFVPRPGTLGSLQSLDSSIFTILEPQPGEVTLTEDVSGRSYEPDRFRYTARDGTVVVVSRNAGVESITDTNGNTLTIGADGITHSSGTAVSFVRDDQERITAIASPGGITREYTYDTNGDLAGYVDAENNENRFRYSANHYLIDMSIVGSGAAVIRNEYDDDGRLLRSIDGDGNAITYTHNIGTRQEVVSDRLGGITVFEYDTSGNVVAKTDSEGNLWQYTYDGNGNQLSSTDPAGGIWRASYDSGNQMTGQTDPLGNSYSASYDATGRLLERTDESGHTTRYEYDSRGNRIARIDAAGNTATASYDSSGNLASYTDNAGNTTTYTHNAGGVRTSVVDALGQTTAYSVGVNGNVTQTRNTLETLDGSSTVVWNFEYNDSGQQESVFQPGSAIPSTTTYDNAGLSIGTSDPLGNSWTATRNTSGAIETVSDGTATLYSVNYDLGGRDTTVSGAAIGALSRTLDTLGNQLTLDLPNTGQISQTFNSRSLLATRTDSEGNVSAFTYDGNGRLEDSVRPDGSTTTRGYDAVGNIISSADELGRAYSYDYDELGRLTSIMGPDGLRRNASYDEVGNIATTEFYPGEIWAYEYDELSRMTGATGPLGNVFSYGYDSTGNVDEITTPEGRRTLFVYDGLGRMVRHQLPEGQSRRIDYDAAGRILSAVKFGGETVQVSYDDLQRSITRTAGGTVETTTYDERGRVTSSDSAAGTVSIQYDGMGRMTAWQSVDATEATYGHDIGGRVNSFTTANGQTGTNYDVLTRTSTITFGPSSTQHLRNTLGIPVSSQYQDGLQQTNGYDAGGRAQQIEYSRSGSTLMGLAYAYDTEGRIQSITRSDGGTKEFAYDGAGRLSAETTTSQAGTVSTAAHTYDRDGNLIGSTRDGVERSFVYDANDRLLRTNEFEYRWDANGNLIGRVSNTAIETMDYDSYDRLVAYGRSGSNPVQVEYGYDFDGLLHSRRVNGQATFYSWDRSNREMPMLAEEIDEAGALIRRYLHNGLSITHSVDAAGGAIYYLRDHVGTPLAEIDENGTVVRTVEYDAYGRVLSGAPSTIGFANAISDPETGFVFMRSRWYNPEMRRFVNIDSATPAAHKPATINRYTYASGDPVNRFDPNGQSEFTIAGTIVKVNLALVVSYATVSLIKSGPVEFFGSFFGIRNIVRNFDNRRTDAVFMRLFGSGSANINAAGIGITGGYEALSFFKKHKNAVYLYFGPSLSNPGGKLIGGGASLSLLGIVSRVYNTPTPDDYQGFFVGVSGSYAGSLIPQLATIGGGVSAFWSPNPTYQVRPGGPNRPVKDCSDCEHRYSFGWRLGTSLGVNSGSGGGGASVAFTYYWKIHEYEARRKGWW